MSRGPPDKLSTRHPPYSSFQASVRYNMTAIFLNNSVPAGYGPPRSATSFDCTTHLLASLCKVIFPPLSYRAAFKIGCMPGTRPSMDRFSSSNLEPSYLQNRWSALCEFWLADSTQSSSGRAPSASRAATASPCGKRSTTCMKPPACLSSGPRPRLRTASKNSAPHIRGQSAPPAAVPAPSSETRAGRASTAALATARMRTSSSADQRKWALRRWSYP
mmetsp:Transcript_106285/g.299018  ORF Transcript_106285/g.299018 Transcript_106285/m.299018 type:complete len:218 (-) Transcript_106285:1533-2186(-)